VPARTGRLRILVAFWVALGVTCAVAAIAAIVRETPAASPPCAAPGQCGGPPTPLPPSRFRHWSSPELGIAFAYPPGAFELEERSGSSVRLRLRAGPDGVEGELWVSGTRARAATPEELLRRRKSQLAATIVGLAEDDEPATVIVDPRIGRFPAAGGSYRGTLDTPQGPAQPAIVTLVAATDGSSSVVVSFTIAGTDDTDEISAVRALADPVLTGFEWRNAR
jgi:hypothetical protein